MANYSVLKAAVQAVVRTNGNQEITGANLQSTLLTVIDSLGAGYQFMGVATPSTTPPSSPDYNIAYIGAAGTYANFGTSYTVPQGSIGIFKYNGTWTASSIYISEPTLQERVESATGLMSMTIEQGGLVNDTGEEYNASTVIRTGFIDVQGKDDIAYVNPQGLSVRMFQYGSDKSFIRSFVPAQKRTLEDGVAYVRYRLNRGSDAITPADAGGFAVVADDSYIGDRITSIEKKVGIIPIINWSQGALYADSGEPYNSDLAIRTGFIAASGYINIDNPNSESWKIYQYDENQSFLVGHAARTAQYYRYSLNSATRYIRIQMNDSEGIVPSRAEGFYLVDDVNYYIHRINELQEQIQAIAETSKSISILFVGNSLTQDGIAYLPYMLKTYYPNIDFKFYMWYNGGYTLAQQYTKFVNDETAGIFSVCENAASWTNYNNSKKMSDILTTYTFDVVCMQEYFNYKSSYTVTDLADWNNCRNYIQSHYTGGNGLEFISLFHAPLRESATSVFNLTESGNALILQQTIAQDMIPIGMAVYNALSTELDDLGDEGHLSPDGTHTQEGLPCLLQTYTALCWLFDKLAINKSIYGCPMRMTTEIYQSINVPGPNLGTGVITGSDAQNILAQEVAIQAYKEGKAFVAKNIYLNQ